MDRLYQATEISTVTNHVTEKLDTGYLQELLEQFSKPVFWSQHNEGGGGVICNLENL